MPIVVACSCGKKYQVGDDKAGMKLRCKACQAVIAVPTPKAAGVDEFDDFGLGDDFGAGDDFGDPAGQGEPIAPRPKTAGKKGSKSKGKAKGRAKAGGKKKSAKGKSEMSPAVKYSLAGGIVVVTIGIVLGILYARGVIGGGKKDAAPSGGDDPGSSMASGDLVGDPGGAGNPGAAPKVKQPVQPKKWTPRKEWTPDAALLGQTSEPQALKDFPEYQLRIPKFLKPTAVPANVPLGGADAKLYLWTKTGQSTSNEAGLVVVVARAPGGRQLPAGAEKGAFENMVKMHRQAGASVTTTQPQRGQINGMPFQRLSFTAKSRAESTVGFVYVALDQNRTVLLAIVGGDNVSNAAESVPVLESAVLSFQRQGAMSEEPAPKQSPSAPQAIAAADLLKQNPVGSKTLEKKTIRVRGTVARPLDQGGWLHLTGDAQRTVACQFKPVPQTSPAVGQAVVVEGTFFQSLQQFVTIGNCKLVSAPTSSRSSNERDVRLDQYGDITSFALSQGGTTIVTCRSSLKPHKFQGRDIPGRAAEIRVWDVATSKLLATLEGPDSCNALSVAPRDGNIAAILASNPKQIVIWNSRTGRRLKTIPNSLTGKDAGDFQSVLIAHDGRAVYSYRGHSGKAVGEDGKSTLLHRYVRADVQTGELKAVTVFNRNLVMPMAPSPTADVLAVGVVDRDKAGKAIGIVRLLDGKTGQVKQSLEFDSVPTGISYSADGRRLAVAMRKSKLAVVNLESGQVEATLSTPVKDGQLFGYENAAVSADGTYALVRPLHQGRPKVELWHVSSKKVRQLDGNSAQRYGFTTDGRIVALSKSKLTFLKPEQLMQQ